MTRTMTVYAKNVPQTFQTTLTDAQAFEVLEKSVNGSRPAGTFAQSLVQQARFRGLSAKQWAWVHKLAMEMIAPPPAPVATVVVGGLQKITEMLQTAAHNLKWPRIVYRGVRLSLAKAADTVNVTSDERAFAARTFYGRITPGGSFQPTRSCAPGVAETLADLATDPASKTAAEGKRTGACCFCGRELSTKESLHVGYGPVCAEKYGLPWGETGPSAAALAADRGEEEPEARWARAERADEPGGFEF